MHELFICTKFPVVISQYTSQYRTGNTS